MNKQLVITSTIYKLLLLLFIKEKVERILSCMDDLVMRILKSKCIIMRNRIVQK